MQTRYITERYIKNEVEKHQPNNFSSLKTYSIFKGNTYGGSAYLEFTGYKYLGNKGLVIGADRYYLARQKFQGDKTVIAEIEYVQLTIEQCKAILDNQKILADKIKSEKPLINEEIYHDFTISDDLFISYKKARGSMNVGYMDIWIKGEKYSILTSTLITKLNKFIEY
jgi:hypothetical protein